MAEADHASQRRQMIATIEKLSAKWACEGGGETISENVLDVMADLPRHAFVPEASAKAAYGNEPLAIGYGQTISQPFMVALMTTLARIEPHHHVLEIGTGSGYQTAVLAKLAARVFSIEVVDSLARGAMDTLAALGIGNVTSVVGDGRLGLAAQAPFDAIVVTAAPAEVPAALLAQLKAPGRLVIPVGDREQTLRVLHKAEDGSLATADIVAVRFVPLVRG